MDTDTIRVLGARRVTFPNTSGCGILIEPDCESFLLNYSAGLGHNRAAFETRVPFEPVFSLI
jgi:hypothetical protein